jgi:hypothetical protein
MKWGGATGGKHVEGLHGPTGVGRQKVTTGLKGKDLMMVPARVALALQADGWWLRSDVVWAKPNTMPESCGDRPTRAHEFVFLLAKSQTYYYDANAIKEPASLSTHARISQPNVLNQSGCAKDYGEESNGSARRTLSNYATKALGLIGNPGPNSRIHKSFDPAHPGELNGKVRSDGINPKAARGEIGVEKQNASFAAATTNIVVERNKRDVWTVAASPVPSRRTICPGCGAPWEMRDSEAAICVKCGVQWEPADHFAAFPPKLIEPCILAGSRPGDVVLDPFGGSGVTGKVSENLGRRWIVIELSEDYNEIALENTRQMGLRLFDQPDDG